MQDTRDDLARLKVAVIRIAWVLCIASIFQAFTSLYADHAIRARIEKLETP